MGFPGSCFSQCYPLTRMMDIHSFLLFLSQNVLSNDWVCHFSRKIRLIVIFLFIATIDNIWVMNRFLFCPIQLSANKHTSLVWPDKFSRKSFKQLAISFGPLLAVPWSHTKHATLQVSRLVTVKLYTDIFRLYSTCSTF